MPEAKSIPVASRPAYEAVIALTDAVCREHLNDEWAHLCRELAASLARKRPSPLLRGEASVWAAGILHALGLVNFLFDRSQAVSMSVAELCAAFGVKQSTVGGKSKLIRGFLIDARYAPTDIQAEAYRRGLIPYIPGQAKEDEG